MSKKSEKRDSHNQDPEIERDDKMIFEGVVEEALPGTLFRVVCNNDHRVLATLSGKLRQNHIRVLPGDKVTVEVSPYDVSRGRISWRM